MTKTLTLEQGTPKAKLPILWAPMNSTRNVALNVALNADKENKEETQSLATIVINLLSHVPYLFTATSNQKGCPSGP